MKLITQRELIRTVADRYRVVHEPFLDKLSHGMVWDSAKGMHVKKPTTAEISKALDKLDPETATVDDVSAIMGTNIWVVTRCANCGKEGIPVVVKGETELSVPHGAWCRDCLTQALAMFDIPVIHDSDCAVHRAPAYPAGPCNCGDSK